MAKITKNTKTPKGRPTKYKDSYCKEIVDFFAIPTTYTVEVTNVNKKTGEEYITQEEKPNKLPTFEAFAKKINVDMDTLKNWTRANEDFAKAYEKCKQLQKDFLVQNALLGFYNTTFSIFLAKNITDLRDKVECEQTVRNLDPVKVEIVK